MVLRDDLGDFNQFFGFGQRSRDVDQSCGHPEHAVQHGFVSQGSHLFELFHRRLPCTLTHDLAAQTSLRQQVSDMCPGTVLVDRVQILSGVHRSHPTVSRDNRRTSLKQIVDVRPSIAFEDRVIAVIVEINETRRDHHSRAVNANIRFRNAVTSDHDDSSVANRHMSDGRFTAISRMNRPVQKHDLHSPIRLLCCSEVIPAETAQSKKGTQHDHAKKMQHVEELPGVGDVNTNWRLDEEAGRW